MILIALGANLPSRFGSPEETLVAAEAELARRGVSVLKSSHIWLSAPVPVSDQPWYRNSVIAAQCALSPQDLLKILKEIEVDFGRAQDVRNAPRVLDLDIIAYDDGVMEGNGCVIPHPRAHERAFVLYPLREVAQAWVHPVTGLSVNTMIEALPAGQEIEMLDGERGAA